MTVTAVVLIKTDVAQLATVRDALAVLPGVSTIDTVVGPYDIVCRVVAPNLERLGSLMVDSVQEIPGVAQTLTCPVIGSNPDLGIVERTSVELTRAVQALASVADQPKCAVFGSSRAAVGDEVMAMATEIGRGLAATGWMVITGGGPGVMRAAAQGAGRDASIGLGIAVPHEPGTIPDEVHPDRYLHFEYFFNRKLTFMRESSAYVLLPGGFGTLDESFELLTLLQTGKEPPAPVILLAPPGDGYWARWHDWVHSELVGRGLVSAADLDMVTVCDDVPSAVATINDFYRVYDGLAYRDGWAELCLRRPLDPDVAASLPTDFADLCSHGAIEVSGDVVRLRLAPTRIPALFGLIRAINRA